MDIPCICPPLEGKPRHASDTVTLRQRLGFRESLAAQNAVYVLKSEDPDATAADVLAVLTESYLLSGIEAWSVVGVDGKPIDPTKPAIREYLLPHMDAALAVAEAADDLYRETVITPLVDRASTSSPPTPTDGPTSPTSSSEEPNQNHSSPSSITTTPMDDTETTSLALGGVSNSSPN